MSVLCVAGRGDGTVGVQVCRHQVDDQRTTEGSVTEAGVTG